MPELYIRSMDVVPRREIVRLDENHLFRGCEMKMIVPKMEMPLLLREYSPPMQSSEFPTLALHRPGDVRGGSIRRFIKVS